MSAVLRRSLPLGLSTRHQAETVFRRGISRSARGRVAGVHCPAQDQSENRGFPVHADHIRAIAGEHTGGTEHIAVSADHNHRSACCPISGSVPVIASVSRISAATSLSTITRRPFSAASDTAVRVLPALQDGADGRQFRYSGTICFAVLSVSMCVLASLNRHSLESLSLIPIINKNQDYCEIRGDFMSSHEQKRTKNLLQMQRRP